MYEESQSLFSASLVSHGEWTNKVQPLRLGSSPNSVARFLSYPEPVLPLLSPGKLRPFTPVLMGNRRIPLINYQFPRNTFSSFRKPRSFPFQQGPQFGLGQPFREAISSISSCFYNLNCSGFCLYPADKKKRRNFTLLLP